MTSKSAWEMEISTTGIRAWSLKTLGAYRSFRQTEGRDKRGHRGSESNQALYCVLRRRLAPSSSPGRHGHRGRRGRRSSDLLCGWVGRFQTAAVSARDCSSSETAVHPVQAGPSAPSAPCTKVTDVPQPGVSSLLSMSVGAAGPRTLLCPSPPGLRGPRRISAWLSHERLPMGGLGSLGRRSTRGRVREDRKGWAGPLRLAARRGELRCLRWFRAVPR